MPGGKLNVGRIPADATAMILHTRNGTHGSATDNENNHPVVSPSGDIRMVHNGVIYNHTEVRHLLGKVGKALPDVDSAVIPAIIEEFGLDSTDQLAGYAATAWFDRETDDTIHLARFKQAPIVFATLWDGSFAFASTAAILGRALIKAEVAWYGIYPGSFEEFDEGEYRQIMGGETIGESTVEWKSRYSYSGPDWGHVTSSNTSNKPGVSQAGTSHGFGASKGSEGTLFSSGERQTASEALAEARASLTEDMDDEDSMPFALSQQETLTRAVISTLYKSDPEDMLTEEEYDNWVRYDSIYGPNDADFELDADEDIEVIDGVKPQFYLLGHDGNYTEFTTVRGLFASMTWHAALTPGEDNLVGPEEGELRWVNHFSDVGSIFEDEQHSWVENNEQFLETVTEAPVWLKDGIGKLRQMVGA